jgi:putative ABC transport system permease protein
MIELKKVNKFFNKGKKNELHVINNTSLMLPDVGLIALLGPSGCGKTTLLNAIGGLDSVQGGTILVDGKKISSRNMSKVDKLRSLSIGYIFQDYKLLEDQTVFDNVAIALKMVGIKNKEEMKVRVEYVLEKVGMLRYRHRPVSMLSGGERQRVGIARALVKNPDIVLADEPTGNLDSRNSVEIMNIIKTISKERLVILVTHERNLAEFYASRIIEVMDGTVTADRQNEHDNALDYELDNVFYLKEFPSRRSFADRQDQISVYASEEDVVNLKIVVKHGNLYIQAPENQHVEVVEKGSGIELVDDYKRQVDQESIADYDFHLDEIGDQSIARRYSSIQNFWTAFFLGFKKISSYTTLRKLLLVGFLLAGCFISFAFARIGSATHVEQKDYITANASYLQLENPTLSVEDYSKLTERSDVAYVLPGDSKITLTFAPEQFYQSQGVSFSLTGSLSDVATLTAEDITVGRLPETEQEFVVDRMLLDSLLSSESQLAMFNIRQPEELIGRTYTLKNGRSYTLVGLTDRQEPNLYLNQSQFIWALYYTNPSAEDSYYASTDPDSSETETLQSYRLAEGTYQLKRGRLPENAYECIVNYEERESYPLNKTIDVTAGKQKLKVVGYYTSDQNLTKPLVNDQTLLYDLVENASLYTICPEADQDAYANLTAEGYNVTNLLADARSSYQDSMETTVRTTMILAIIIIAISLIEMFLISRSSFLSRIKEVGTLRAIGMKKWDVYKIFLGEVLAVTTLTDLPAILITFFGIQWATASSTEIAQFLYQEPYFLLLEILLVYAFNVLVGLLPVWNTMRKRPAAILARYDID